MELLNWLLLQETDHTSQFGSSQKKFAYVKQRLSLDPEFQRRMQVPTTLNNIFTGKQHFKRLHGTSEQLNKPFTQSSTNIDDVNKNTNNLPKATSPMPNMTKRKWKSNSLGPMDQDGEVFGHFPSFHSFYTCCFQLVNEID